MTKEQAIVYLRFSGFSEEQIKAIEGAFACDKCVYSTSEGCQYDDITETIPPFEDCISRQAVLDVTWEEPSYTDALNVLTEVRDKVKALPPVNPQKPICPSAGVDCEDCPAYEKKSEWQQDHEILKAYSDGANEVLDKIRAEIEQMNNLDYVEPVTVHEVLQIIDKHIEEVKG